LVRGIKAEEIKKGCEQCVPPLIEFYNGSLFLVTGVVLCKKCNQELEKTITQKIK